MKLFKFILLLSLLSCSTYVDRIHKEINDNDQRQRMRQNPSSDDTFAMYRREPTKRPGSDKKPFVNPITFRASYADEANVQPKTKRDYRPVSGAKRYTAGDLMDNESSGSLWAGEGKENYLFNNKSNKKPGDFVIVNVQEGMKNLISNELKRAFPTRKIAAQPGEKKEGDPAKEAPVDPKADDKEEVTDINGRVYDKISAQVMEDLNNNYVLVSGVKEVLFKKNKHLVRIEGVTSRKHITDDDTIFSEHLLDSRVYLMR